MSVGLKGNEFLDYFAKVPHVKSVFLNVVAINEIPKIIPIKHFLICNLSLSHLPGTHWIAIIRPEKDILEVFNSLGYDSLDSLIPYFKFRKHFQIHFNKQELQADMSISCGFFCIYFIIHRILNFDLDFDDILQHVFTENKIENERLVNEFCNNLEQNGDTNLFI